MVKTNSDVKSIRKKLMAAVAMLLVASIMVVSSSYAWFTLSTAPEVKGIQTSVGANGNLEMALRYQLPITQILNTDSKVEFPTANTYWGNLVDLSHESYHLADIALRPARLNGTLDTSAMTQVTDPTDVTKKQWTSVNGYDPNGNGLYTDEGDVAPGDEYYAATPHDAANDTPVYVRNVYKLATGGYLQTPVYGTDGRISELAKNTVNGIYSDGAFNANNSYLGVRAVGVQSNITPEALALRNAKQTVSAAIANTKSNATISLRDDSIKLAGLFLTDILDPDAEYTDTDVTTILSAVARLQGIVDELEAAMKQAVVAVGVSQGQTFAPEAVTFSATDITVADVTLTWSGDLVAAKEDLLAAYGKLDDMRGKLTAAKGTLEALDGGTYSFSQLSGAVTTLLSTSDFRINGKTIEEFKNNPDTFGMAMEVFNTPTISIVGGIYFYIAEFSGNYDATTSMIVQPGTYMGVEVKDAQALKVKMVTAADETKMPKQEFHLPYVQIWMAGLVIEGGTASNLITDIYGYVIDLAFRTNASGSSLKLQTEAANRVNDSEATQGAGSYMQFGSGHTDFTLLQVANLMQSIRVVFTDDSGTIYGVAALDVAYETAPADAAEGTYFTDAQGNKYVLTVGTLAKTEAGAQQIKAPLYMYNYTIDAVGKMTLDGKSTDSIITTLDQNVAKGVSALVFLDGDEVDNADVATSGNSMTGTMNLQFSSSASLTPMNYTFQTETPDDGGDDQG